MYRDWYNNGTTYRIATVPFTLQAYPGEKPWFDGSDVVSAGWTSNGSGQWYRDWSTPQFCSGEYYEFPPNMQAKSPDNLIGSSGKTFTSNAGPCSHYDNYGNTAANFPMAGDPQNLFVNGQRMAQVASLAEATAGKFYYDWAARRMYISSDPTINTIELSVRPTFFVGGGTGPYQFKGIGLRRFATNEGEKGNTNGALYIGSPGTILENTVLTQMSAQAANISGKDAVIKHNTFVFNGFNGLGTYGSFKSGGIDNLQLLDNLFNMNNLESYGLNCSLSCAAAHYKASSLVNYLVKNNVFENGIAATGAWCDTNCSGGKWISNMVRNNPQSGIDEEMNSDAIIASNVVSDSKYCLNVGSSNVQIYNNTLVGCKVIAMRIYDDNRPQVTSNIIIYNNIIYGLPTNLNYFQNYVDNGPDQYITGFDYNAYWRSQQNVLYRWITSSADNYYQTKSLFIAAKPQFEQNAIDIIGGADPFFVNLGGSDYHVRSNSAAYNSGGPIASDVASAIGVTTAAGQSRGALIWPGSTSKIGDINKDNKVDISDLSILVSKWNTTDAASDLNGDGTVNIFDLSMLISRWG